MIASLRADSQFKDPQTFISTMTTFSATQEAKKQYSNLPSRNLLRILSQPQIVEKQPAQSAAVLVHEVRNPLTNINLAVELLKSTMSEGEQKIYLDIIRRSSIRINDLLNELLKYQQADEAQPQKHSIHDLLDEVLKMAADRISLKNIMVRKNYAAQDCKLVLNEPTMKIALTNIIINAIDAMASVKGELTLATQISGDKYIIRIEDNGSGISKENLKNIFQPFFTNKPGGVGLGLSATHAILLANHATVNVQSEKGKGTRFTLLFNCIL
jgi:signal transduction histidine kinase